MLSIIIPTLNEENYLPFLLESIKNQDFKDYEIIVADAGSHDKTREIAKNFGCKVVSGGLPAKGRNEGTKFSRGNLGKSPKILAVKLFPADCRQKEETKGQNSPEAIYFCF